MKVIGTELQTQYNIEIYFPAKSQQRTSIMIKLKHNNNPKYCFYCCWCCKCFSSYKGLAGHFVGCDKLSICKKYIKELQDGSKIITPQLKFNNIPAKIFGDYKEFDLDKFGIYCVYFHLFLIIFIYF